MRFTSTLGLIITVIVFSCFCSAQECTAGFNSQEYHCVYGSCDRTLVVYTPDSWWGDYQFSCEALDCCQQLFTNCYYDGYCGAAKKAGMSPAILKYLEDVPLGSEFFLVADCNGHYVPFKPAAPNLNRSASFDPKKFATFATLDDRALR